MTFKKAHLEWSTPFRLDSHGENGMQWTTVRADVGGKETRIAEWAALEPDTPLLPYLLETLAERYGQGQLA